VLIFIIRSAVLCILGCGFRRGRDILHTCQQKNVEEKAGSELLGLDKQVDLLKLQEDLEAINLKVKKDLVLAKAEKN